MKTRQLSQSLELSPCSEDPLEDLRDSEVSIVSESSYHGYHSSLRDSRRVWSILPLITLQLSATLSVQQKKPKEVESEAWTSFLHSCTTVRISMHYESSDFGRRECIHSCVHSARAIAYGLPAKVMERE